MYLFAPFWSKILHCDKYYPMVWEFSTSHKCTSTRDKSKGLSKQQMIFAKKGSSKKNAAVSLFLQLKYKQKQKKSALSRSRLLYLISRSSEMEKKSDLDFLGRSSQSIPEIFLLYM